MSFKQPRKKQKAKVEFPMRLNKYVAVCGICSRRKAAELVKKGEIKLNGKVELNPAVLVSKKDIVEYQGKNIQPEKEKIYLLLNKPKQVLSTVSDDRNRKTVYDLVKHKIDERIYPVGRLDRDTTGLLLMTNDGHLADRLAHPRNEVKKIYHVVLNKSLTRGDLTRIRQGVKLSDGIAIVDSIDYVQDKKQNELGIELHLGKNRIIRRIFESLGYVVKRLDRVYFAGLTKKDLPRGRFRHLTQREIVMLKHFT